MTNDSELAARALARWLAPYVAEELGLLRGPQSKPSPFAGYDDATCAVYVASLGDVVLHNAEIFFARLGQEGEIGSLALADAIGVAAPGHRRCPHHTIEEASQGALAAVAVGGGCSWPADRLARPRRHRGADASRRARGESAAGAETSSVTAHAALMR